MRYSIEPRDKIYVKGYGFLSFAKNMCKNLRNKYGKKLLNSANDRCNKNCIKKSNSKTAEATDDLIGNKIADKITSVSKKSTKELQHNETEVGVKRATPKKRYISPEERQQIIDELRLVKQYNNEISKNGKFVNRCIK